jgi:oxazoline/thiazoline dehydrogenase
VSALAEVDVPVVLLGLMEGASLETEGTALCVKTPPPAHRPPVRFDAPSPALLSALRALAGEGLSPAGLAVYALGGDGGATFGDLQRAITVLDRCALLARTLHSNGRPIATLHPVSIYYAHRGDRVEPGRPFVLSRFACVRRDGDRVIVETPLGHARVVVHDPGVLAVLGALAVPRTSESLARQVPGLPDTLALELMNLLADAGALSEAGDGAEAEEEGALAQWEFHDLLFHARSRLGRHSNPFGGTYRFKGSAEPLPVVKPAMAESSLELHRPDLARLEREDRPFSAVLEGRRSWRRHGDPPIDRDQLGEFLFRSARIQKMAPEAGVSFRPHPGGGAIHELEIYPLVSRCSGLDAGLYHYDAAGHRLEALPAPPRYLETLLRMAAITAELEQPPQVLLIVSARFQRIQWKYQSMAYGVVLKNVGALYQTMYLVATAMGLAPCALGGGHADLFAAAAGVDYLEESSVGEFILGSRGE